MIANLTRLDSFLLFAAIAIGIAVRFYGLGTQSLWIDEIYSTRFALAPRLDGALFAEMLREPHPPLWTTFLQVWSNRIGVSEILLRLPAAVASALAIPAMYFLGRRLIGPESAGVATIIMAMSSFLIVYAQDARPYGFLTLFSTLATLTWLHLVEDIREGTLSIRRTALFILLNFLLSYTHYFGFLLVGLLTAYLFGLALSKRRLIGYTLWVGLASAVPFLLWFVPSIAHVSRLLGGAAGENWMKEFTVWDVASLGRALFAQPSLLILLLLPFLRFGREGTRASEVWWQIRREPHAIPLAYAVAAPLGVATLVSLHSPVMKNNSMIIIFPAAYALIAIALCAAPAIRFLGPIRIVFLIYSCSLLTFLAAGYPAHKVPYYAPFKEQFRDATLHVVQSARSGDVIGSIGHRWSDVAYFEWFRIYLEVLGLTARVQAEVRSFPNIPSEQPPQARALLSTLQPGGSLFIIGGHGNFLSPEARTILSDATACHRARNLINAQVHEFHMDRARCR